MHQVSVVGLDLAKSVFQVHGVNAQGEVVLRRRLTRGQLLKLFENLPSCLIGMEACASAHHWARELAALGHEVKLMPAQYVKPYVKGGKNDAADAEAICEAVTRPTMRFVAVKSPDQQATMMLHRVRKILTRQRTQISNALRAHMAEFGIAAAVGRGSSAARQLSAAAALRFRSARVPQTRTQLRLLPQRKLQLRPHPSIAHQALLSRRHIRQQATLAPPEQR
jgi:transposase